MDRRTFLTGIGTIGAATAGGWTALESAARGNRAEGLARAAGAPKAASWRRGVAPGGARALQQGLSVGYLPGGDTLLSYAAQGRPWNGTASRMRWAAWTPSLSRRVFEAQVDVSIGLLQSAAVPGTPEVLRSLEVVAHFALDGSQ